MKVSHDLDKDIMSAYTIDLWSMQEIADVLHIARTSVHKRLKSLGIDTSKHRITVSCTVCGGPVIRTRKQVRLRRNHFCNRECYNTYLQAGARDNAESRYGQTIARSVTLQWFDLQDGHVVHHIDHNQFNNAKNNLMVFSNQGDHIRHHHNQRHEHFNRVTSPYLEAWERYNHIDVEPIWDGRNL